MTLRSKLTSPFALVGQGFLVGAALFHLTAERPPAQPSTTAPQAAAVQPIADI